MLPYVKETNNLRVLGGRLEGRSDGLSGLHRSSSGCWLSAARWRNDVIVFLFLVLFSQLLFAIVLGLPAFPSLEPAVQTALRWCGSSGFA